MITHGILADMQVCNWLAYSLVHKKINWKKTKVFDNSNRGQKAIYKEDWK